MTGYITITSLKAFQSYPVLIKKLLNGHLNVHPIYMYTLLLPYFWHAHKKWPIIWIATEVIKYMIKPPCYYCFVFFCSVIKLLRHRWVIKLLKKVFILQRGESNLSTCHNECKVHLEQLVDFTNDAFHHPILVQCFLHIYLWYEELAASMYLKLK